MPNFFFLGALVSGAWEGIWTLLRELLLPHIQRTVTDTQLTSNLRCRLAAALHQFHGFFFEFFRVDFLCLCHDRSFPQRVQSIPSLVTLSNRGKVIARNARESNRRDDVRDLPCERYKGGRSDPRVR